MRVWTGIPGVVLLTHSIEWIVLDSCKLWQAYVLQSTLGPPEQDLIFEQKLCLDGR
jgi:hypothetical protein